MKFPKLMFNQDAWVAWRFWCNGSDGMFDRLITLVDELKMFQMLVDRLMMALVTDESTFH